jgi:hypothetical protein
MDRWAFLGVLAGLCAAPLAAEAQQAGKVRRVGILSVGAVPSAEEVARSPFLRSSAMWTILTRFVNILWWMWLAATLGVLGYFATLAIRATQHGLAVSN